MVPLPCAATTAADGQDLMNGPRERSGRSRLGGHSCSIRSPLPRMVFANRRSVVVLCALATGSLAGCRARASEPAAPIRLVDLYKPAAAAPANTFGVSPPPPVEWRFAPVTAGATGPQRAAGHEKPPAWTAGPGIQALTVR